MKKILLPILLFVFCYWLLAENKYGSIDSVPDTSDYLVAHWDFSLENMAPNGMDILDLTEHGFVGTLKGTSWIRTIGETKQFDVFVTGEGEGYFDLGTELGEFIYGLEDYTIACYFRISEEVNLADYNNYTIWNFANALNPDSYPNGYMYANLKNLSQRISADSTKNETGLFTNIDAPTGSWHHLAYSQTDSIGRIFLDGELMDSGIVRLTPKTALLKDSLDGTPFNWLGRFKREFSSDLTLYDFRIYSKGLTQEEINNNSPDATGLNIANTIEDLEYAYADNCDCYAGRIWNEIQNFEIKNSGYLTPGDTLPLNGLLYPEINISWLSTPGLVDSAGVVTLPDYLPQKTKGLDVKLTGIFAYRQAVFMAEFDAFIPANPETQYTSDTLIHFNFGSEQVIGSTVTDLSEQHFKGTLMKGAEVKQLWDGTNTYDVLKLWDDSSYFDMGTEIGKVIYALKGNFSFSVYFLVDASNTTLKENGNFLFTFSNKDTSSLQQKGYCIHAQQMPPITLPMNIGALIR
ncbi:LamG-like jellyroll fold domain-containing protein [Saccharicrinis sp. FJH54]|uniref:LamG-like jellyroll fold domain-containing protein n=1 Tax=Saccharicrinis sp. FJH54 TaxID=3344665 RepID=UPI0035D3F04A